MTVGCRRPLCDGAPWAATGQAWITHRGNVRVGVVCKGCGAVFSSVLPEAVEATRVILEAQGKRMPVAVPREPLEPTIRQKRTRRDEIRLGAGDEDIKKLLGRLKMTGRLDFR